ncbi:MAG: hypothetical protein J2P36_18340, partial [Ktedonobacteraceae bacterium]|nr:hypothetical protein [Ktedonobacteraceae bacterium]
MVVQQSAIAINIPRQTKSKEPSTTARLQEIAATARYLRTPEGILYARIPFNEHEEIVPLEEKGGAFRRWLIHAYKARYETPPPTEALALVLSGIVADAAFKGETTQVAIRIAAREHRLYLDLADEQRRCVEITGQGWHVLASSPVDFLRTSGMLALPEPVSGGTLQELRDIINVKDERSFILLVSWLLGTFHPTGPYPVLCLNGEQGSGKSKATALLRNLVDPHTAPARSTPRDMRDVAIAAHNNMILAFDNLSSISREFSDVLCRMATGNGFATRTLYSNDQETVFSARRPVILNGIEDGLIGQSDLLSRTMHVTLEPPQTYRTEGAIDASFEQLRPRLLGALLDIVVAALRNHRDTHLKNPPRMADFACWVTSAEEALGWPKGTFLNAYNTNQQNATS